MKREEKSVIQRFLVVLMVVMLLVTPSQGEADSTSTGFENRSTLLEKSNTENVSCLLVPISNSTLDLPYLVRLGILQNSSDRVPARLFYNLLPPNIKGNKVSFTVDLDGEPIKAFSGPDCTDSNREDSNQSSTHRSEKGKTVF